MKRLALWFALGCLMAALAFSAVLVGDAVSAHTSASQASAAHPSLACVHQYCL